MLADFAVRLAFGLVALSLIAPWRDVPPAFFRTHCLVVLGLLVLASLDAGRVGVRGPLLATLIAGGVMGYVGAVGWGLGLPRVGQVAGLLVGAASAGALVAISRAPSLGDWMLAAGGRVASAFLMGSTLTAMLLGHHYLTAPAMSIAPLERFVRCFGVGLALRGALAAVGLAVLLGGRGPSASAMPADPLFLTVRWGVGLVGPAVAAWMAWQTVRIRSTQSATGILYIAMTLVLFGELTAMVLTRDTGVFL